MTRKKTNIFYDKNKCNLYYQNENGEMCGLFNSIDTCTDNDDSKENNFINQENSDDSISFEKVLTPTNLLISKKFKKKKCNYKPCIYYHFHLQKLVSTDNLNICKDLIKLKKGLYKFDIFLNINSRCSQKAYFFMRNNCIVENSLKIIHLNPNTPNNINHIYYFDVPEYGEYNFGIITCNSLVDCLSYINISIFDLEV